MIPAPLQEQDRLAKFADADLVPAATVKAAFANVTDMTLWRWLKAREFPQPATFAGRRYWIAGELRRFRKQHFGI